MEGNPSELAYLDNGLYWLGREESARKVVTMQRDDGVTAVIAKGLEEGQLVVTDGQSRLQNGTRVSIISDAQKQAANPPKEGG